MTLYLNDQSVSLVYDIASEILNSKRSEEQQIAVIKAADPNLLGEQMNDCLDPIFMVSIYQLLTKEHIGLIEKIWHKIDLKADSSMEFNDPEKEGDGKPSELSDNGKQVFE